MNDLTSKAQDSGWRAFPDRREGEYRHLALLLNGLSKRGRWVRICLYSMVSVPPRASVTVKTIKEDVLKQTMTGLIRRFETERVGVPGYRGYFRLTQLKAVI